jgi:hypothetical protein
VAPGVGRLGKNQAAEARGLARDLAEACTSLLLESLAALLRRVILRAPEAEEHQRRGGRTEGEEDDEKEEVELRAEASGDEFQLRAVTPS